jgi:hypothetical protein
MAACQRLRVKFSGAGILYLRVTQLGYVGARADSITPSWPDNKLAAGGGDGIRRREPFTSRLIYSHAVVKEMFNRNAIGVRAHADGVGVKQSKAARDVKKADQP